MIILAIDPGSEKSALVLYDTGNQEIYDRRIVENELLLGYMGDVVFDMLVIEMIASYGMPVGKDVFETCVWIGRFIEHSKKSFSYIYRREEKMFLCGSMKAKDSNIRQAIIDKLGKEKTRGCSKDIWSALAVALTFEDTLKGRPDYDRIPF